MKRNFLILLVLIMFTVSGFAGIEWTSKITTTAKKKRNRNNMTLRVAAQDGIVRVDYLSVKKDSRLLDEHTTWLYNAKDNKIYVMNSKEKTVTPMSIEYMLNISKMVGKVIKIKIKDYKAEVKNLGTEKINGYTCKHIRLITDYTMKTKVVFIKSTSIIHEEKDIWSTTEVKGLDNMNNMYLNKDLKTGFDDFDELIRKQMKQIKNLGFRLKTVERTVYKSKKGKVRQDLTTTTTVEDIVSKKFPKSYFQIPKDYTVEKFLEGPKY